MADNRVEALKATVAALDEANVPDELREVAFTAILSSYLGTTPPKPPDAFTPDDSEGGSDDDSALGKIAALLKADVSAIERVFDVDEDGVHILASRTTLASSKQEAQRQITYLVAAAERASGSEWTESKSVRAACDDRGVLDGNFSASVEALRGEGVRINGTGQAKKFKLNNVGVEKATEIVKEITGSS